MIMLRGQQHPQSIQHWTARTGIFFRCFLGSRLAPSPPLAGNNRNFFPLCFLVILRTVNKNTSLPGLPLRQSGSVCSPLWGALLVRLRSCPFHRFECKISCRVAGFGLADATCNPQVPRFLLFGVSGRRQLRGSPLQPGSSSGVKVFDNSFKN